MDIPEAVKMTKIVKENYKVKTFFLDKKIEAQPGQFIMVWIPGIGEKPFSLSFIGNKTAVTVEKKGIFTEKLFKLKVGNKIGIRGPYGKGFILKNNACVVAGGLGIAPLMPLIKQLKNPLIIYGAKTKKDLLFLKEFKKYNHHVCTDDGSLGCKILTPGFLDRLLKEKKFNIVYTCGPEVMIKKVFDVCEKHKIRCEASLERYMKCGFGVCGSCVINEFRVCKDGPVFSSKDLRKMTELGTYARLKTGKKVLIQEYYGS